MRLYDLPQRQEKGKRPIIYGLEPNGNKDGIIEFHHLDGAYSYCTAYDDNNEEIGPIHLSAATPLEKYKDGYRVPEEVTDE